MGLYISCTYNISLACCNIDIAYLHKILHTIICLIGYVESKVAHFFTQLSLSQIRENTVPCIHLKKALYKVTIIVSVTIHQMVSKFPPILCPQ